MFSSAPLGNMSLNQKSTWVISKRQYNKHILANIPTKNRKDKNNKKNKNNIPIKDSLNNSQPTPTTPPLQPPKQRPPGPDGFSLCFSKIKTELDTLIPEQSSETKCEPVILHAGCGVGELAERIDFTKYNAQLHGVDVSYVCIEVCRVKQRYKELTVSSLEQQLPYPADYFDFVVADGMLGYSVTSKPLYDLIRVVRSGGYVMLTMRSHHFQDRLYPEAIMELETSLKCRAVRQHHFSAFPNNREFNHEYLYTLLQKI